MHLSETPISSDLASLIASRFAALAEPSRVRILDALRRHGELSVTEIAVQVNLGYANVAKHLSLLHRERVVGRTRDGTRVVYRIIDPSIVRLCDEVCGAIAQQHAELAEILSAHPFTSAAVDGHEENSR